MHDASPNAQNAVKTQRQPNAIAVRKLPMQHSDNHEALRLQALEEPEQGIGVNMALTLSRNVTLAPAR